MILFAGALALATAIAGAPTAGPNAPAVTAFSDREFADALLAETNRVRWAHGRRPFLRRRELEAAAGVAQWMDSPPHRANLLSRDFTHFGAAIRFAPTIRTIWAASAVRVFAAG